MAVRSIEIPGRPPLELAHLVLDVNGTLTNRGELIDGVEPRLRRLQETLSVHLLSADTFGTLDVVATSLGVRSRPVRDGAEKAALVRELGAGRCATIGNGANDVAMLREAALAIAVIGPEGAAAAATAAADLVCRSIVDALELLLDDRALAAGLRPRLHDGRFRHGDSLAARPGGAVAHARRRRDRRREPARRSRTRDPDGAPLVPRARARRS